MDPDQPDASESLQNTSPEVDSAEYVRLQEIIVRQILIIRLYQEQLTALQATMPQSQPTMAASTSTVAPNPTPFSPRTESFCMALQETFDSSADQCRIFLRQCQTFFDHQPNIYREDITKCAFLLSLLTGRALDWASPVWDNDPQVSTLVNYFMGQIRKVFEYPAGGRDIPTQLFGLHQGFESGTDFAVKFHTLAAQSGWNDTALRADATRMHPHRTR